MLPNLVLPRLAGFDAVALYNRATQLSTLSERIIVGAITPVILPAFAAMARNGADLRKSYLYGVTLVTAVQWPALVGLAILAEPVVRIILGGQWDAVAELLRILALAGVFLAPAPLTFPILVASGRTRDTLTASVISLSVGIAILAAAAPFGLRILALSFFVSLPMQMFVALAFIRRCLQFTWGELVRSCWRSACCALISAVPPFLVAWHGGFSFTIPLPLLFMAIMGGVVAWLLGLAVTGHPLMAELRKGFSAVRGLPVAA
jgi:O-antigen/teichoic acid export membrane protein